MPIHGASHQFTGSGFGTKTGSAPRIWDNCSHGNSVLTTWPIRWHDSTPGDDGDEEDYRDPDGYQGVSVALPHSRITKVLCGTHGDTGGSDVYVSRTYTPPAGEWWSVWSYLFRVSPNFGHSGDSNFKLSYITDHGSFAGTGGYAYVEFESGTWTSNTVTGFASDAHNAGDLSLGWDPSITFSDGYPANPAQGWLRCEMVLKCSPNDDAGLWRHRINASQIANEVVRTHTGTPSTWQETLGGFARDRDSQNVRYYADIYNDVQASNPGRFYLTNHATWGSETITAIQPWTVWAADVVTVTINGGALDDGTVHVHYRDEVNGNQYLGTMTLGATGGCSAAQTCLPIRLSEATGIALAAGMLGSRQRIGRREFFRRSSGLLVPGRKR